VGWALVLLLIPPQHEYPILDDWIYAGSVRTMLDTHIFVMPPQSQANLIGLTLWGLPWVSFFGFSYTVLTYSTLFWSLVALFAFYGIARALHVGAWGALLATALLGFNPLFLHLSYSFMTDVPFLGMVLASCYFYIIGLQRASRLWLLPAGLLAGWAFTIRQFGLLVPVAFLAYLLLDSLLRRKWRWLDLVLTALVPLAIFVIWYVWSRDIPPTYAQTSSADRASYFILKEPWLRVFAMRSLTILPLTAFFAWTAVKLRPSRRWLVALWLLAIILGETFLDLPNEGWTENHDPPFTAQFGSLSFTIAQEMYTFEDWGNLIRRGGIDFFEYPQEPIWTSEIWRLIWVLGLGLGALILAKLSDSLIDWTQSRWQNRRARESLSPAVGFYLLGALTFVISMAFPGALFDRYILAFIPFLILFLVRGSATWGRLAWTYSIAALAVLVTFTLLAQADFVDHNNARWRAAGWMIAHTGAVHVGFDYNNSHGPSSDTYFISDIPTLGTRVERVFPYFSRLGGFTTRYVLAQARTDMPPLPVLPGDVPSP
jgi:4-amino-4-deoxy-L-arabinose transferase-like glycosyltransferase